VVTRADDLLAEVRGAMAVRDAPERLRSAVAELDAFMSAFGVMPKDWRVRIADVREPASSKMRAQVLAKLGVIVRDTLAEAGYHDQALAGAVARDVLEAMLEEQREVARLLALPAVTGTAAEGTGLDQLTTELTDWVRDQQRPYCVRGGPHGMHFVGTSGLVCHGRQ
jgi:regulator of protease activity HflC (stomatin/prohibitin superfamily)